ncbi:MAG: hypothetical protein AAF488_01300 [Planctomycetota bacterium]
MPPRWSVVLLLFLVLLALGYVYRHPLGIFLRSRPATPEEVRAQLEAPHHLLSPTGWHATPERARGSMARWRENTPVGIWYGYYVGDRAEGWVRRRFDLNGDPIGGYTFFLPDGQIEYQFEANKPGCKEPPWLWNEDALTDAEMRALDRWSDGEKSSTSKER